MSQTRHSLGRLKKRSEFLYVREGRYKAIGGVVIQMRANELETVQGSPIRAGFTATKKIGNAVTRNRAKRLLREAAREKLPTLGRAGHDYVFIARQSTVKRPYKDLLNDVEKALLSISEYRPPKKPSSRG